MNMVKYLRTVMKDKERKPIYQILKEAIHCVLIEKELPYYYFTSLLYKKGAADYRNYIGHKKVCNIIIHYFYPNGRNDNLENKLTFSEILLSNDVHTPKIIAHSTGKTIRFNEEEIVLTNDSQLKELLIKLVNASQSRSIFVKPVDGEAGKHTFKFDRGPISLFKLTELYRLLDKESFIFQETVIQHHKINEIYPNSLNTLRIHTFLDKKTNNVEIVSALMRFGSRGNVMDNASAGGIFIPLRTDNWSLIKKANAFLSSGGKSYTKHPSTNYIFDGTTLPHPEQITHILTQAARLFENEFIGWDLALTETGPIIIEANDNPHLIMAQMACGGFKNHSRYKEIFAKYI
ncbi:sugar-transfer associated ATP-grasp domain-containing protein [Jeotgalibacillus proteolyticus]|uniref:Alpha-L-glutamate ligase-related protein ATP-grasp domain-containing protein n=1 Tax=Jeotgalibacillus proteolyticus TaxID=2082395 RepID=A0A2S5G932_9BACL|nr:sugar-transfer associated ATP-grasp domain-containing protein [Jeotgalibacillus proteolyticus]PPA69510.1 hypothetical protein C4B60_13230 [Jeotgalibacillus proteolyticus]